MNKSKTASLKGQSGSALLIVVVVLLLTILTAGAAMWSHLNAATKATARVAVGYQTAYAVESLALYVKDAADLGASCRAAGSPITCPSTANACSALNSKLVSFWLSGTPGVGPLFCFTTLPACSKIGKLGVNFQNPDGTFQPICLVNGPSTATSITTYAERRKFHSKSVSDDVSDILISRASAGGPYSGLPTKYDIPAAMAPAMINSSTPGLPARAAPASLASTCVAGAPSPVGEQCQQSCTVAQPCLQMITCLPNSGTCVGHPEDQYTISIKLL